MSDVSQGPGWWLASDNKWYPPESASGYQAPTGESVGQVPGMVPNYPTNPNVTFVAVAKDVLGRPYAGWWSRVGATLIDGILLSLIGGVIGLAFAKGSSAGSVIAAALTLVYGALMIANKGGTLGNMAVGTMVVDAKTGAPVTPAKAWGRAAMDFLFKFGIFLFAIPTLLDYLWPLWDRQNQTLHDKAAGTVVVKKA